MVTARKADCESRRAFIFTEIQESLVRARVAQRLAGLYGDTLRPQAQAALKATVAAYQADRTDFLNLLDKQLASATSQRGNLAYFLRVFAPPGISVVGRFRVAGLRASQMPCSLLTQPSAVRPVRRDVASAKAIHSALMPRPRFFWAKLAFPVCAILSCAILSPTLVQASKKKELPTLRWTAGAPGCTFETTDDGHYRWTMTGPDLSVALVVDSQELAKSRHRFYRLLGAHVSVTYTGQGKFEFPADVRIDFVRHHDVLEAFEDPSGLSNRLQNDVDTKVFETERQIKKNPTITEEKTALLREYEKAAAEFIEFISTQGLDPNTVMLTPGNPEAHGWVFFATSNKWIGPWKEREDFVLSVWMKDKVWQFPFSLPPAEGGLILRKPPE